MSQCFVGGLSTTTEEKDIYDAFKEHGSIVRVDLRSGYAFVEYAHPGDADRAIDHLDGSHIRCAVVRVEKSMRRSKKCYRCNRIGHFEADCQARSRSRSAGRNKPTKRRSSERNKKRRRSRSSSSSSSDSSSSGSSTGGSEHRRNWHFEWREWQKDGDESPEGRGRERGFYDRDRSRERGRDRGRSSPRRSSSPRDRSRHRERDRSRGRDSSRDRDRRH
eukprot:NODE_5524_length_937_cov_100.174447_g5302_i0.p2 GENE.NODE_5524_length_937_cov_100.174447_g5302_i0~~NODE_5524_length_937_cov_100.174447_g5302_i0.p2  ORF type:complete len:219 (+),score=9.94 NODE_5524_length_937_cov_100.174447_g5302_i0:84-740(+)